MRLNLSRSGPSLSLGVRGAHVTVGKRGVRRTVGIPGTGIFYTTTSGTHTGAHTAEHFVAATHQPTKEQLLRKLADLHRAGVLSDAEYQTKRDQLSRQESQGLQRGASVMLTGRVSSPGCSLVRVDRHFDLPEEAVRVAAEDHASRWDRAVPAVLTHPIAHLGNLRSECLSNWGVEVHRSSQ